MSPKQDEHKALIWILCIIPPSLLLAIITYGIWQTPRTYAPTISVLLSDYIELSIVFGFLVACYTVLESYVAVEYINHDKMNQNKGSCSYRCIKALPWLARICIMLKNASFVMIPIVRVDEYRMTHYVFAGLTVFFASLMFIFYVIRRTLIYRNGAHSKGFIVLNYFILFLVLLVFLLFVCGHSADLQYKHDWAISEYTLYFIIGSLNIFWIYDINEIERSRRACNDQCCQNTKYL
jgi:hypothetical protein